MQKSLNKALLLERTQTKNIVWMEKVSSIEMYLRDGESPAPVLADIDFSVNESEAWGINGTSLFEIRLLLEIIANIKAYDSGRVRLIEKGMLRHKRVILPHVCYIGSPTMIYQNMNVLEYLMFVTARQDGNTVLRQEKLFEYLIEIGLGFISLSPALTLTKEQKAVVLLLVGGLSESELVVFNFPDYKFDDKLRGAVSKIAEQIRQSGRCLIIGTQDSELIESSCSHTAFLDHGRILYNGLVNAFRNTYDRVIMTIWDENILPLAARLSEVLPEYGFKIEDGSLTISCYSAGDDDPGLVYAKIAEEGFAPYKITVNPKKVSNAYEEILKVIK